MAQTLYALIEKIDGILRTIIVIMFPLATAFFLWGVIQYISSSNDEKKLKDARQKIIYGVIGLFMMVAVWGIVRAIVTSFGLDENPSVNIDMPPQ